MQRWSKAVPAELTSESAHELGPIQKENLWRDQFISKYLFIKPFEKYFHLGLVDLQSALKETVTGNGFKWNMVDVPQNRDFQGVQIQKRLPFDAHKRMSMRISKVMKIPFDDLRQIIPDPDKREEWDEVYVFGKQVYELDDFHDVVFLLFEGARFILSRAHISSVEKGLRKYSMTEQSIPSDLIQKDLTEIFELKHNLDFEGEELDVSGGWELEELDPVTTKVSYVVRLIPEEDIGTSDVFDALCIQRARCLIDLEARIQYYRKSEGEMQRVN
jgi:hypothetical protein